MNKLEPIVTGPHNKYAGKRYRLNPQKTPAFKHTGTNTNAESWAVIEAMFKLNKSLDYWDLCVACRHHKHGTKAANSPQAWINYLIREQNRWLVEA